MRRSALTALLVLALAGCGATEAAAPETAPAAPLESGASASTNSPPPTAPKEAKVGATQVSSDATSQLKVTVLRARQPLASLVPGLPERKSYEYAAVEVKTCIVTNTSGEEISLSWGPWTLSLPDGTVIEAMNAWSSEWWDVSLYPNSNRAVRTGRCVRGWIPFEVPKGSKPQYVGYSPEGTNSLEWVVR